MGPSIAKIIRKKDKVGGITYQILTAFCKATVFEVVVLAEG